MTILGFSESDNGGYLISSDSIETPRRSALIFVWFDRIFNVCLRRVVTLVLPGWTRPMV